MRTVTVSPGAPAASLTVSKAPRQPGCSSTTSVRVPGCTRGGEPPSKAPCTCTDVPSGNAGAPNAVGTMKRIAPVASCERDADVNFLHEPGTAAGAPRQCGVAEQSDLAAGAINRRSGSGNTHEGGEGDRCEHGEAVAMHVHPPGRPRIVLFAAIERNQNLGTATAQSWGVPPSVG